MWNGFKNPYQIFNNQKSEEAPCMTWHLFLSSLFSFGIHNFLFSFYIITKTTYRFRDSDARYGTTCCNVPCYGTPPLDLVLLCMKLVGPQSIFFWLGDHHYHHHAPTIKPSSKMDDIWLVLLQLLVVGSILGILLTYLLRGLVCKATLDVGTKSVLITGCDTGIGHELAKYLDSIGFHVFAGCLDTSSEGAQRLRVECSPFLKLVNMDVTRDDHVQHAVQYVLDNLPAGENGKKSDSINFCLVKQCKSFFSKTNNIREKRQQSDNFRKQITQVFCSLN